MSPAAVARGAAAIVLLLAPVVAGCAKVAAVSPGPSLAPGKMDIARLRTEHPLYRDLLAVRVQAARLAEQQLPVGDRVEQAQDSLAISESTPPGADVSAGLASAEALAQGERKAVEDALAWQRGQASARAERVRVREVGEAQQRAAYVGEVAEQEFWHYRAQEMARSTEQAVTLGSVATVARSALEQEAAQRSLEAMRAARDARIRGRQQSLRRMVLGYRLAARAAANRRAAQAESGEVVAWEQEANALAREIDSEAGRLVASSRHAASGVGSASVQEQMRWDSLRTVSTPPGAGRTAWEQAAELGWVEKALLEAIDADIRARATQVAGNKGFAVSFREQESGSKDITDVVARQLEREWAAARPGGEPHGH